MEQRIFGAAFIVRAWGYALEHRVRANTQSPERAVVRNVLHAIREAIRRLFQGLTHPAPTDHAIRTTVGVEGVAHG
jgi:hypothetical protein